MSDLTKRLRDEYAIRFASETEREASIRRLGMVDEAIDRIEQLQDALRVLAKIPVEDFGKDVYPDYPILAWNGHTITVCDVFTARALIGEA